MQERCSGRIPMSVHIFLIAIHFHFSTEVTFYDASAYFSEEDWKPLHKWQKELYRNVMKEIQQALISLGPLIATTVFSLKSKEKETVIPLNNQESESKHKIDHSLNVAISNSNELFSIHGEEKLYLNTTEDTEQRETNNKLNTGIPVFNSSICLRKEEEPFPVLLDHLHEEVQEAGIDPTSGRTIVSFRIKGEEKTSCMNHQRMKRRDLCSGHMDDVITNPDVLFRTNREQLFVKNDSDTEQRVNNECLNTGNQVFSTDICLRKEKEAVPFPFDRLCEEDGEGSTDRSTDNGRMNRKRNVGNAFKCNEKPTHNRLAVKKVKGNTVHNIHEINNSVSPVMFSNDWKPREETPEWQSGCSGLPQSTLHPITPHLQESETSKTWNSNAGNGNIIQCESSPLLSSTSHTFTESKPIAQKNTHPRHQRGHKVKGRCICSECGSSFSVMSKLIAHERIHTGERPYHCTICGKSFNQKGILQRHQQMHTGERPFQCNVCGKSFTLKHHLIGHQKIHAKTQRLFKD